mmetsp:Transcript_74104/g.240953  ORF Transcript_74104/g.240953 Transcript_74104/m.240953 type:complete len:255 (-) Transcript_74104:889-1653(-)
MHHQQRGQLPEVQLLARQHPLQAARALPQVVAIQSLLTTECRHHIFQPRHTRVSRQRQREMQKGVEHQRAHTAVRTAELRPQLALAQVNDDGATRPKVKAPSLRCIPLLLSPGELRRRHHRAQAHGRPRQPPCRCLAGPLGAVQVLVEGIQQPSEQLLGVVHLASRQKGVELRQRQHKVERREGRTVPNAACALGAQREELVEQRREDQSQDAARAEGVRLVQVQHEEALQHVGGQRCAVPQSLDRRIQEASVA